jgi:hypothetical protein
MIGTALTFVSLGLLCALSVYWYAITRRMIEDIRAERMKAHLNWVGPQRRSRISARKITRSFSD